jgi:hypothetical protein
MVCNKSKTKGDTIGAGTEHTSGAPELTPAVSGVHAAHVFQLVSLGVNIILYTRRKRPNGIIKYQYI